MVSCLNISPYQPTIHPRQLLYLCHVVPEVLPLVFVEVAGEGPVQKREGLYLGFLQGRQQHFALLHSEPVVDHSQSHLLAVRMSRQKESQRLVELSFYFVKRTHDPFPPSRQHAEQRQQQQDRAGYRQEETAVTGRAQLVSHHCDCQLLWLLVRRVGL